MEATGYSKASQSNSRAIMLWVFICAFGFMSLFYAWDSHHFSLRLTLFILLLLTVGYVGGVVWLKKRTRTRLALIYDQSSAKEKFEIDTKRRDILRGAIPSQIFFMALMCLGSLFGLWTARHDMKVLAMFVPICLIFGGSFLMSFLSFRKSLREVDERLSQANIGETL